jgi:hypothetical protein
MSTGQPDRGAARQRPDGEQPELAVLREIWSATGQTSAELDELFGTAPAKVCKNMKDIGFGGMAPDAVPTSAEGTNTPVDADIRSAWRRRLEREGKLDPAGVSVRELLRARGELD